MRARLATGGHLASSLGAVELITAIHYVFDTPRDRLVLDVGHQGYPHKMLTGRREAFDRIGQSRRHLQVPAPLGVASTTPSAPATPAPRSPRRSAWRGRSTHQGADDCAIALIGDGGMTAGMAFEALNHAGHLQQKNLVVVLNDNEMSISPNVGALSSYLSRKLSKPMVRRMKGWAKEFLGTHAGRHAPLGAQGRGVAQGLLLAGDALRGAELQVRRADPGAPHGRAARDLREREADAGGTARARSWCTPSPRRATATSPPSRIRSSTTASGPSTWPRARFARRSPDRRSTRTSSPTR